MVSNRNLVETFPPDEENKGNSVSVAGHVFIIVNLVFYAPMWDVG